MLAEEDYNSPFHQNGEKKRVREKQALETLNFL